MKDFLRCRLEEALLLTGLVLMAGVMIAILPATVVCTELKELRK